MKLINTLCLPLITLTALSCSSSTEPKAEILIELPKSAPAFSQFKDVKEKKKAFFDYMFAYVVHANNAIKIEREFIQSIDFSDTSLNSKETKRLTSICEKYSNNCENVFRDDLKIIKRS